MFSCVTLFLVWHGKVVEQVCAPSIDLPLLDYWRTTLELGIRSLRIVLAYKYFFKGTKAMVMIFVISCIVKTIMLLVDRQIAY